MRDHWDDVSIEDCAVVCDDCWKKIMPPLIGTAKVVYITEATP